MNTVSENSGRRFWMWIGLAFSLGVVAGFVLAVGGIIVLQAMISYAP